MFLRAALVVAALTTGLVAAPDAEAAPACGASATAPVYPHVAGGASIMTGYGHTVCNETMMVVQAQVNFDKYNDGFFGFGAGWNKHGAVWTAVRKDSDWAFVNIAGPCDRGHFRTHVVGVALTYSATPTTPAEYDSGGTIPSGCIRLEDPPIPTP